MERCEKQWRAKNSKQTDKHAPKQKQVSILLRLPVFHIDHSNACFWRPSRQRYFPQGLWPMQQ